MVDVTVLSTTTVLVGLVAVVVVVVVTVVVLVRRSRGAIAEKAVALNANAAMRTCVKLASGRNLDKMKARLGKHFRFLSEWMMSRL